MSGDSELPPTYYFSGITFNPNFYQSSSSEYLTASTGKKYFLSYPIAQGTETISTLKTSSIDTATPTSDFNLLISETGNINIGTTVPSSKTIKIGQSTGSSIHCGSIDCTGTNINNAVSPATGIISIVPSQTTGALNIGSNSTTATRTTGPINIGSNVVGTTPITIGMSGKSTTALNGTVSVGSSMNTTGIVDSGTISSTGLITGSSFQNTANSGSISSTGVIGGSALQVSNSISVGGLAAITGGVHVTGDIKTTTGKLIAGTLDALADTGAGTTALKIGSNILTGDIEIGNAQTTGDIKIGLSDISGATITVGTSSTATTINGTLATGSITATGSVGATTSVITPLLTNTAGLSIGTSGGATSVTIGGSTTPVNLTGITKMGTNGTTFREIRFGTILGGSGNGTVGFTPNMVSNPIVFAQIISSSSTQTLSVGISSASTTGFSYNKNWVYNNATAGGNPLGESIYWIAISP